MRRYFIIHDDLAYAVNAYGTNKRAVVREYREQWGLTGKHIHLEIWEG